MNVDQVNIGFFLPIILQASCEISTHVGILPNCLSCPYGKSVNTCEELCEPYRIEIEKVEIGSVGFIQPDPVIDIISANSIKGIDHDLLLDCPSVLSVIDNNMIIDDRFLSENNKELIMDMLQKEIDTNGTILTKRQFEVLYMTYVDGLQPSEIAPLLSNNDIVYNLHNAYEAGNITEDEYNIRRKRLENEPRKQVTSQTVLFHLRRAIIKLARESGLREEIEPIFKQQRIKCAYINCNIMFTPTDKNQKYHSVQCRRKHKNRFKYKKKVAEIAIQQEDARELKVCINPRCKAPFVPHDAVQVYCTVKCRKRHYTSKYAISKKKKMSDIFNNVSRCGEVITHLSISFTMRSS